MLPLNRSTIRLAEPPHFAQLAVKCVRVWSEVLLDEPPVFYLFAPIGYASTP